MRARTTTPSATTSSTSSTRLPGWSTGTSSSSGSPSRSPASRHRRGSTDDGDPRSQNRERHHGRAPQGLALRLTHRRPQARGVRGRGAGVGVPARRARPHQGQAGRDAGVSQELPDDDLRLVRYADGRPRRPRLQGADGADRRSRPRARHLGDGKSPDRQGPRRRHGALLGEDPRGQAVARPRLRRDLRKGASRVAAADERDRQGVALHHVRLLRQRVQLDGGGPGVPRPGGAGQGVPLRRRPARGHAGRAARRAQRRARELGRPLCDDDRLVARDRARPEDARHRVRDQADGLRVGAGPQGQGPAAVPAACRGQGRGGARALGPGADARRQGRGRDHPDGALARADRARRGARRAPRQPRAHSRRRAAAGGGLMQRVAYYKGCLASLSAKELDISTQALAPKVGLELDELEAVTCCGAGDIHEAEPDYYLHLNARILAYAEATGSDTLMTVCNVCTLNLRQANFALQNDEALLARVNENLEAVGAPRYSGAVDVKHLLWMIAEGDGFERLKATAHKGLKGLKVAPFYGCQILRPSKLLGFDDPDRPHSLEAIIEACGGEAIDYPAKIKCCGFPIIQAREETALGELIQPLEQATEAGADAMVTPCPLCHLSLDAWQSKLKKATGRDFRMPILHLSQLIGVAAGIEESELKFKRHVVSVAPVLEKLQA